MVEEKEDYKRFTVSLPQDLYDKFEILKEKLNISRSDCIRKAMHAFMISEENISESTGEVVGCITIIMAHEHLKHDNNQKSKKSHEHLHDHEHEHFHTHDYSSKPIYANVQQTDSLIAKDIQHHFSDIILSTLHIHLEFEKCMEIIAVSGAYKKVKSLRDNLQRLKSVISTGFFVVDRKMSI